MMMVAFLAKHRRPQMGPSPSGFPSMIILFFASIDEKSKTMAHPLVGPALNAVCPHGGTLLAYDKKD